MAHNIKIAIFMLSFYGIAEAKVLDIHPTHPGEQHEVDSMRRDNENKRDRKTFNSPRTPPAKKEKALDRLIKNGGMS